MAKARPGTGLHTTPPANQLTKYIKHAEIKANYNFMLHFIEKEVVFQHNIKAKGELMLKLCSCAGT